MEPKENRLCSNCKHYAGKDQIFGPCDKHEVTIVARNASCPCWRPVTILRNDCENAENAAWELAQRIGRKETEGGMTLRDLYDCFGYMTMCDIFNLSYKEARERYDAWVEEHRKAIYIGDEVETESPSHYGVNRFLVTRIERGGETEWVWGFGADGSTHCVSIRGLKKTGKYFDSIDDYLKTNGPDIF